MNKYKHKCILCSSAVLILSVEILSFILLYYILNSHDKLVVNIFSLSINLKFEPEVDLTILLLQINELRTIWAGNYFFQLTVLTFYAINFMKL